MENEAKLKRLRWRCCRRGMLELDTLLTNFFDQSYLRLSEKEQEDFGRLLECHDQELFLWLMGRATPNDSKLTHIITSILSCQSA